jgi:hypothetical protein
MLNSALDDLLQGIDPIDAATLFAGLRNSVPLSMLFRSGETNAGHDEELARRQGPRVEQARPALDPQESNRRAMLDFMLQYPDVHIREAYIDEMLRERRDPYSPTTATRRRDFEEAPVTARHSMQAAPKPRRFNKGGGVKKALDEIVVEMSRKGAKPVAKPPLTMNRAPRGLLPPGLDIEKLAQSLGVKVAEAPNVLPPKESGKNLRKFVKPSAVQHRVFHGSNVPEGIVEDGQFAHYAPDSTEIHWFATDPNFADQYTSKYMESPGEQGAIFPAYIQMKNPLEIPFDMNSRLTPEVWKFAQDLGLSKSEFKEWISENDKTTPRKVWQLLDSPQFREAAIGEGYDGLKAPEAGSETFGVFYPERIKSQFNEGTYNTKTPDLGKKDGGSVQSFNKGGGVKKTLDEMAAELMRKGTKVADKPDLARRGFFGLGSNPAFPLANLDAKALEKMQSEFKGAPAITEKTVTVDPGKGAAKSTLKSLSETPLSRREVLKTAAGQALRGALPDLGGLGALGNVAKAAKSVAAPAAMPETLQGLIAHFAKKGFDEDETIRMLEKLGHDEDDVLYMLNPMRNPVEYVADLGEEAMTPSRALSNLINSGTDEPPMAMRGPLREIKRENPDMYKELIRAARDISEYGFEN